MNKDFMDSLALLGFIITIMNYEENLTQSDKQDLMSEFDNKASSLLQEIHEHLELQDKKLDEILEELK